MEDNDIIELFNNRSEKVFTEIEDKYGKRCRKIAGSILADRRDAEECINTAYLSLWNSIPPKQPKSLCGYLFSAVRNTAINTYNKIKQRSREALYDELDTILPTGGSVEEEYDASETARLINDYLLKGSKTSAKTFVLRYYFNMSVAEVAEAMAMSENAVKSRLSRTRKGLKEYLEEKGVRV